MDSMFAQKNEDTNLFEEKELNKMIKLIQTVGGLRLDIQTSLK